MRLNTLRFVTFLSAFLSIILFPWWVGAILAFLGLIFFDFVEIVFLGFVFDMMYGISEPFYSRFFFLIISLFLYILISEAKKSIRV